MEDAWKASPEILTMIIGEKAVKGWKDVQKEWEPESELRKIEQNHYRLYIYSEPDYPQILKKIPDPPPVLYSWGHFEYGDDIAVAIVGTRNPTPIGAFTAKEFASQLSFQGISIISGLARGIDAEAHRGALEANGRTIAVLGCGIDIVYPRENEELMERIPSQGAVISEYPLGTPPLASNFPARNRIISGLSLGVVVVEATNDSGSLITAGFALEQGREVFAVPGNIGSEGSKGPHKLIRQGAKLVENYQDILTELAIPQLAASELPTGDIVLTDEIENKVYLVMNREPLHIDQITRLAGLSSSQVTSILVQLELRGIIKRFPGQLYMRLK